MKHETSTNKKTHNATVTAAAAILRGWSSATYPTAAAILRGWDTQSDTERETAKDTIRRRACIWRQEQHQRHIVIAALKDRDNAEKRGDTERAKAATAKASAAMHTAADMRTTRAEMVTAGERDIIEYMTMNTAVKCIYAHEAIADARERAQNRSGTEAAEMVADVLGMSGDSWVGAETEETRAINQYGETIQGDGDTRTRFDVDMYASDIYIMVKDSGIVLDFLDFCALDDIFGGDTIPETSYNGEKIRAVNIPFSIIPVLNNRFDVGERVTFQNRPFKTLPAVTMYEMKEERRSIKIQHPATAKGTISIYTPIQSTDGEKEILDTVEPVRIDENPTPEEIYAAAESREDIQKLFIAAPDLKKAIKNAIPCLTDIYGNHLIDYKVMSAVYRKAQTIFSTPENIPENIKNAIVHLGMNQAGLATYHAFIRAWKSTSETEKKTARERAAAAIEKKTAAEKAARRAAQAWRKEHPTLPCLPSSISAGLTPADRRKIERAAKAPELFTIRAHSAEGAKIRAAAIAAYMETAQQYYKAEREILEAIAERYTGTEAAPTAGERLSAYRYSLTPEETATGRAFLRQIRAAVKTWEKNPAARQDGETAKDAFIRISAAILERHTSGTESENAKRAAIVAMSLIVLSSLYSIIHLRDFREYITIGDAAQHITPERAFEILDTISSSTAATIILERKPANAATIAAAVAAALQDLKRHERKTASHGESRRREYITQTRKDTESGRRDTITTPATLPPAYLNIIQKAEQERRKAAKK